VGREVQGVEVGEVGWVEEGGWGERVEVGSMHWRAQCTCSDRSRGQGLRSRPAHVQHLLAVPTMQHCCCITSSLTPARMQYIWVLRLCQG
jgi:hypothetical protein